MTRLPFPVAAIFLVLSSLCLAAAQGGPPSPNSVALFEEPGFPSRSPRPAAWYRSVLEASGRGVETVGVRDLSDGPGFAARGFDVLLLATGGLVPAEAEEALGLFMRRGGTVVIDGSIGHPYLTAPDDVMAELGRRQAAYRKGGDIEAYFDYLWDQAAVPGVVFRWDARLERWVPPMHLDLGRAWTPSLCGEFEFEPWPNPWQVNPAHYGRAFDSELKLHPLLRIEDGALPAVLPPSLAGDETATVDVPAPTGGMLRWSLFDRARGDGRPAPEFANDVLVPVYLFDEPSGRAYPAFSAAGRDVRDRASDFFIYRSHRALKPGYTLVHFGLAGARLLGSAHGEQALRAALGLAGGPLPGERSPDYVEACRRLAGALERYYAAAVPAMADRVRRARTDDGRGDAAAAREQLDRALEARRTFEEVSHEGDRLLRLVFEQGEQGTRERLALAERCEALAAALTADAASSLPAALPPAEPVANPWGRIFLGFDFAEPGGVTRMVELAGIAKALGFSSMPIYGNPYSPRVFEKTGLTTGLRLNGMQYGDHFAQERFDTARLDPRLGAVVPAGTSGWWDTPASREVYDREIGWRLRKIRETAPHVRRVFCMQERSMGWDQWDERMRGTFLDDLRALHGSIERVNALWGTSHAAFDDIPLPASRPETPSQHALWEDWSRFREVYVVEEERRPLLRAIRAAAPGLDVMAYQSYCHQTGLPAHGINYYEYGKLLDWNTLEMGSLGLLRDEVMTADIAGFFRKNITPEWGATYACCMPGGQAAKLDWVALNLWNGLGWGQIGWCTFAGSKAGLPYSNFVDADNRVTPLGRQMAELTRELDAVGHVFLDGQREEPPVRIVFSPTTQRHTNWPDVESEKSFQAASGFYRGFQMLHVQARAIDEGAILDGHLDDACRVLVLPEVSYMPTGLFERVQAFLEAGGTVLATADAGRFDAYGRRRDFLCALAGVAAVPLRNREIDLGTAGAYPARSFASTRPVALEPVFPEGVEILARYRDGLPAVTRTPVGKGAVVLTGAPFGRQFLTEHAQQPAASLAFLGVLVEALGIEPEFRCADPELVVRPWTWQGRRFLALFNPPRTRLAHDPDKPGFPFARPDLATPFELRVKGSWEAQDYALRTAVRCSSDAGATVIRGLAPNPGGIVLALEPGDPAAAPPAPASFRPAVSATAPEKSATAPLSLPFRGRLAQEEGPVRVGDYVLALEAESEGSVWGGALILVATRGEERLRRRCEEGATLSLAFVDRVLDVTCERVSAVMPVGLTCTLRESAPREADPRCALREEPFHGKPSHVIENGLVRGRIVPSVGGRLIEFAGRDDEVNQLYAAADALAGQTAGDGGWVDVGGIEEHLGQWPGPLWNAEFTVEEATATAEEAVLRLTSPAIRLGPDRVVRVDKRFRLRAGEARLQVVQRVRNLGADPVDVRLMVHPEVVAGGDLSASDHCSFDREGAPLEAPFQLGWDASYRNEGSWSAIVDREKRSGLIELYDREAVDTLYVLYQATCCNLEFGTPRRTLAAGEALELEYALGRLRGLAGVRGASPELAVDLTLSSATATPGEPLEVVVEAAALVPVRCEATVELDGVGELGSVDWDLVPGRPARNTLAWRPGALPDGEYTVTVSVDTEPPLTATRVVRLAADRQAGLEQTARTFRDRLDTALRAGPAGGDPLAWRARMVRVTELLARLEAAAAGSDGGPAEGAADELSRLLP